MKRLKLFAVFALAVLVLGVFAGCGNKSCNKSYDVQDKSGNSYSVKVEAPENYSIENPTKDKFVVLDESGKESAKITFVSMNTYKSCQTAASQLPSYQQLKTGGMSGFSYTSTSDADGKQVSYERYYSVNENTAVNMQSSVSDEVLVSIAQSLSVKPKGESK